MMWVVSVWCVVMVVSWGPGSQAVSPELLDTIMPEIWNTYGIKGQYSLAISVPFTDGSPDLEKVFKVDTPEKVGKALGVNNDVYSGTYVVAARPKDPEHAEHRVLFAKKDNTYSVRLLPHNTNQLMVFYTLLSPCSNPCTNELNRNTILKQIQVVRNWGSNYAVVFTHAFVPGGPGKETDDNKNDNERSRSDALRNLAEYELQDRKLLAGLGLMEYRHAQANSNVPINTKPLGIENIYRCLQTNTPAGFGAQCFRCAGKSDTLLPQCVTLDGAAPQQQKRPPKQAQEAKIIGRDNAPSQRWRGAQIVKNRFEGLGQQPAKPRRKPKTKD